MEATMDYRSRREYFRTQRGRYFKTNRAGKARILEEAGAMLGLHRKSVIRALARAGVSDEAPAGPGKPARYGPEHLRHLKALWNLIEQICSKRLAVALPDWQPLQCEAQERQSPRSRRPRGD